MGEYVTATRVWPLPKMPRHGALKYVYMFLTFKSFAKHLYCIIILICIETVGHTDPVGETVTAARVWPMP